MAALTELTVTTWRKPFTHALFLKQEELDLTLEDIRKLIILQLPELPQDYRFLSGNGNVITSTMEQDLSLQNIVTKQKQGKGQRNTASDVKEEDGPKLHICILPTEVYEDSETHDSSSSHAENSNDQGQGNAEFTQQGGVPPPNETRSCHGCPVSMIKNMFPQLEALLTPKKLFKLLMMLTILLCALLAALVSCVYTVAVVTGVTGQLSVLDMMGRFGQTDTEGSKITELSLKLSQLEASTSFELKDLKRRMDELEDLYLRDLDVQRKEVSSMRAKQADVEGSLARDVHHLKARLDKVTETLATFDSVGDKVMEGNAKEEVKVKQEGRKEKPHDGDQGKERHGKQQKVNEKAKK